MGVRGFITTCTSRGIEVSRKRVIRLKQAEGLIARVRKRFKRTTVSGHDQPIAANVLGQDFVADAPNQRWVGDTTEFVRRCCTARSKSLTSLCRS